MAKFKRILRISLPSRQSAFLWGPRKTGKSTYLKETFPESIYYDFLKTDVALEFIKRPALLREQLMAKDEISLKRPIIIDEVQKVPEVMDEVHWLIENKGLRFILCGSSARKLKRGKGNLLGGRAWRFEMFPLVTPELKDIDLLRALNHGLIPDHYFSDDYKMSLQGYVQDYLKEEVFAEGLIRNIPAFARFFDAVGYTHGELINLSNIARDCGVDSKTVKEYYQILADTLLGRLVEPFRKRQSRQVIMRSPRFYLFDVGVAGAIIKRQITETRGEQFGRAFEHFIFMEIVAYSSYSRIDFPVHYWRTKSGLEVDFILGNGEVAVEVKGQQLVDNAELKSLAAFIEENRPKKAIVVSNEREGRRVGPITILPWHTFLEELWAGEIIR
jgi:predicted AAA+ superfamily ATPase